ncbi:hypothetical protein KJ365_03510 [Glaciecola sp. XM2]|jgi:hypothetical protein|uniref:hypothetical protein n=1 Tax=Glaciecola sp. XM2 TaxID=1914931 RepID=UPI001BDF128A|nr:hypothetical protein [Glaciecola sp. XM2]MBT1449936.1 hypothetical protein [Glaciecola sp. XM2]
MKKSLLTASIALCALATSVSAQASDFAMTQDNFETKVCYVAATEGLETAEKLIADKGLSVRKMKQNVKCNNTDLVAFAKRYSQRQQAKNNGPVQLVATNNDIESKICIESLTQGLSQTVAKYRINKEHIRCNGVPLPRFVRQNQQLDLSVSVN